MNPRDIAGNAEEEKDTSKFTCCNISVQLTGVKGFVGVHSLDNLCECIHACMRILQNRIVGMAVSSIIFMFLFLCLSA